MLKWTVLAIFIALSAVIADENANSVNSLVEAVADLKNEVHRLDMLIKFYHPEWTWMPARDCGIKCPYLVNLLDFQAVQWRFSGKFHGKFDLEFVNEQGEMHGNMDFYDRHMWLRHCGWVKYTTRADVIDGIRTWTFAKREDGFRVYAEGQLLVDYTYAAGRCADTWSGPTVGFFFETPATAVHLLQHGMDMLWWQ